MLEYVDLDSYVISPESSNAESDEVEFISETRPKNLSLNNVPNNNDTKRPNIPISKYCLITDGTDELLRPTNVDHGNRAYESTQNTDKDSKSFISGTSNDCSSTSSISDYSHGLFNKHFEKAEINPKHKVAFYEISDDNDDNQTNLSLVNKSTVIKISEYPRNINNITYEINQDENMNDLPETVITEERNHPGNSRIYDLNKIKEETEEDCVIVDSKDKKDQKCEFGSNKMDLTGLNENRNDFSDRSLTQKRKKCFKKKQTSLKRKPKTFELLTPITDLNQHNILSTSEEEDTEVEAVADNKNNKFLFEDEQKSTNELVPRSASDMSLMNLLDVHSDDIEKNSQGELNQSHKPHVENIKLEIVDIKDEEETKDDLENYKPCPTKNVSFCDPVSYSAEIKQDQNVNDFSKTRKAEKEQLSEDSIKNEIKKIFIWSLELSKGMVLDEKSASLKRKSLLNDKKRLPKEKDDGPYICPLCNKLILIQSNLKKHIRCHVTDIPFHCKYCEEGFLKQYDLDRHIIANHQAHKVVCKICQRHFVSVNRWLYHMKVAHPKVSQYTCRFCKMIFNAESKYRKHMTEHNTNVIKESLRLLKEMKEQISLNHSKDQKSPVIRPALQSKKHKRSIRASRAKNEHLKTSRIAHGTDLIKESLELLNEMKDQLPFNHSEEQKSQVIRSELSTLNLKSSPRTSRVENEYSKHMSHYGTDIINESLESLKEMKEKSPLNHPKEQNSETIKSKLPTLPRSSELPLFSAFEDSVQNIAATQSVINTEPGSAISESKEQTTVINVTSINQNFPEHESSEKNDLNSLGLETYSNDDVNEILLVDFGEPKFKTNNFSTREELADINNKNIQKHQIPIETNNENQTVLPKNYLQVYMNYINQTNYDNEVDPLDVFNLSYLNNTTHDSTQTCNAALEEIELSEFSKKIDKIILGLDDRIESSLIQTTELVSASQTSTQCNVDAIQNIIRNDPSQVMNCEEKNVDTENKASVSEDTNTKYIQNVDLIEPMDIESIDIDSRMQEYLVSGLGDLNHLETYAKIPTNGTDTVEINVAGQNFQQTQTDDETITAPISNLVAQTNSTQNFGISSFPLPQTFFPAPEHNTANQTIQMFRTDQTHNTLNESTNDIESCKVNIAGQNFQQAQTKDENILALSANLVAQTKPAQNFGISSLPEQNVANQTEQMFRIELPHTLDESTNETESVKIITGQNFQHAHTKVGKIDAPISNLVTQTNPVENFLKSEQICLKCSLPQPQTFFLKPEQNISNQTIQVFRTDQPDILNGATDETNSCEIIIADQNLQKAHKKDDIAPISNLVAQTEPAQNFVISSLPQPRTLFPVSCCCAQPHTENGFTNAKLVNSQIPTNKTESVKIIANQNFQTVQTKDETTAAPTPKLVAQTNPAQNFAIGSLPQPQTFFPTPEQNVANRTIQTFRTDQPYILIDATNETKSSKINIAGQNFQEAHTKDENIVAPILNLVAETNPAQNFILSSLPHTQTIFPVLCCCDHPHTVNGATNANIVNSQIPTNKTESVKFIAGHNLQQPPTKDETILSQISNLVAQTNPAQKFVINSLPQPQTIFSTPEQNVANQTIQVFRTDENVVNSKISTNKTKSVEINLVAQNFQQTCLSHQTNPAQNFVISSLPQPQTTFPVLCCCAQPHTVNGANSANVVNSQISSNKTESVKIIGGQSFQQLQTIHETVLPEISNLVALTSPAQNFVISSLPQPQTIFPAPEQNVANRTAQMFRIDQPQTLNGATNANFVDCTLPNVASGSSGVKNIFMMYV